MSAKFFVIAMMYAQAFAQEPACQDGQANCLAHAGVSGDVEDAALNHVQLRAQQVKRHEERVPEPYVITLGGTCAGAGTRCDAPGWVYCQDAKCDEEPVVENGVLVAKCHCWAPPNTNTSYLPVETNAGASCVINQQLPAGTPKLVEGGKPMCDAMKKGDLVSTWGPKGWKPPLVVAECPAGNRWAWCWGAPCKLGPDASKKHASSDVDIICDCPMMITNNTATQYLSLSHNTCKEEPNPCRVIHNSSPAGSPISPQPVLKKCVDQGINGFHRDIPVIPETPE